MPPWVTADSLWSDCCASAREQAQAVPDDAEMPPWVTATSLWSDCCAGAGEQAQAVSDETTRAEAGVRRRPRGMRRRQRRGKCVSDHAEAAPKEAACASDGAECEAMMQQWERAASAGVGVNPPPPMCPSCEAVLCADEPYCLRCFPVSVECTSPARVQLPAESVDAPPSWADLCRRRGRWCDDVCDGCLLAWEGLTERGGLRLCGTCYEDSWRDGASGATTCVSLRVCRISFDPAEAVAFSTSDVQRVARCGSVELEGGAFAARTVTVS